jgi:hypothetical protein
VLVDAFLTSLVGQPVRLPAANAPFTTSTAFSAGGFALISERPSGESLQVGLRGAGIATMSFAPEPTLRDAFRLQLLDLQFTDAAALPEPGTMLLFAAGSIIAAIRRRKPGTR